MMRFTRDHWQRPQKLSLPQWWLLFFAALAALNVATYTVSTVSVDLSTYRYLIVVVLVAILFLSIFMDQLKTWRPAYVGLIVVAIIGNLALSFKGTTGFLQAGAQGNRGNAINMEIISAVTAKGLTKGYGNYWQGIINTYLSNYSVEFLPVVCPGGETVPFKWLLPEERFTKTADSSFYILDPDLPDPFPCSQEQIAQQFGEPREVLTVRNKTILIYDYDIYQKMKP